MTTTARRPAPTGTTEQALSHRASSGDRAVTFSAHVVLAFWTVIIIVPLLWTVMTSFKTTSEIFASPFTLPTSWSFSNYVTAWTTSGIGDFFVNTVIVVGAALVIVMILGAMCAYVLARFDFFGARAIYYLMLAGLTFPVFLAIVPLFFVLKGVGLLNTLPGLILTYVAFGRHLQLPRALEPVPAADRPQHQP